MRVQKRSVLKKLFLLLTLVSTLFVDAQSVRNYSNEFLNIGVDAGALGMSKAVVATTTANASNDTNDDMPVMSMPAAAATITKTAGAVLNEFRNDMEQKMLDFDVSAESEMKIPISLAEYTAWLSVDDKERVTMEVLKYMVMEAAEDVNEEWITYKEPSEFMDEATIAVYKEGCAPPEVLEEVNKAELPDEVIQQQKHAEQNRQRQMAAENRKYEKALESGAHATLGEEADNDNAESGIDALGTNKRDRRTLEDYERERKKGRTD